MKNFLLCLLTALFCSPAFGQQSDVRSAFLEKWNNSAEYLLEVIDSIPADSMHYQPTERQMSVANQLLHIRMNMLWLGNTYFGNGLKATATIDSTAGKEELKQALREAFDSVHALVETTEPDALTEEVEFFAGPKSRLQILNLLQDHVTHHRAQLIVYMNLMGITPPRYRGW